ncbi:MAG: alpha/beta hydrolase [Rhodococcus sp. (in: high G+C Gram-positive bacteria)]
MSWIPQVVDKLPSTSLTDLAPVDAIPAGRTVELPGRGSTYVTDSGDSDAPPLILLHALACTGLLTWYPVLPEMSKNYRVITLDQRWHGRGIKSDKFHLEDCADDVAALADVLGLDKFLLAGYSMGGLVAQLTWRRHPDRVRGLVLCSTAANFERGRADGLALGALRTAAHRIRPKFVDALTPDRPADTDPRSWAFREFRSTPSGAITRAGNEIVRFDSRDWVHRVDVPAAVCVTTRDKLIPAGHQRRLTKAIDGATQQNVDAGHAACVMKSDKFVPAFKSACASVNARA